MFYLAIRHLLARRRQTTLTLLGIFFGSMAYVVISGFMLGFQDYLIDQLINNDAHLRVWAKEDFLQEHTLDREFFGPLAHVFWASPPGGRKDNARIEDPQGWYRRLRADPRVEAYSPQLTAQVIFSRAKANVPARLIGSEPVRQVRVTNIGSYMVQGRFTDIAAGGNRILLGAELIAKLGARISETVLVSNGHSPPVPCKIVGIFKTGIRTIDEGTAFGALPDVQRIAETPNQVNEIAVRLFDVEGAANLAGEWRDVSEEKIQSWDQINANFLNVFTIQNAVRYMMVAVILIVAGFGIYNILNMVVNQKRRDIAILRSMGYTTWDVMTLFLIQGLIVGVIGAALGLIGGYWICRYLETVPFGGSPLGAGAGHMTVSFTLRIYVYAAGLSIACAALASLLPARAAGRLQPIEIIRAGAE
jgi:lipoprotein-releasing system permease protein